MKIVAVLACAVFTLITAGPVHAVAPQAGFANCTALAKKYPAGVAKSKAAADRAVADGMRRPKVSAQLYAANAGKDRDKDGVACEQSA